MADGDDASRRRASEGTIDSLLQLDPSPIESPTVEEPLQEYDVDGSDEGSPRENGAAKPGSLSGSTTSGVGLSSSGWGGSSIFYLTRIQRYSSYAMSIFTSLHLANVSLIPAATGSVDASETYLLMTREIYQTSLTEPLLIALPFLAHVGSGIALRLIRRSQNIRWYGRSTPGLWPLSRGENNAGSKRAASPWPAMSWISVSGYAFTIFYSAHAFMNRILPLAVEGDSSNIGLGYVSHGFARHPWVSQLAYLGLIGVGVGHMVWGGARWLGAAPSTAGWLQPRKAPGREKVANAVDRRTRRERRKRWLSLHAVVVAGAAAWMVGGLRVVGSGGASGGWVGGIYDGLYAKVGL